MSVAVRHNWTLEEIQSLFNQPLLELVFQAATIHRQHHTANEIQMSTLLSIKTGACTEDCAYCSQSSRNKTGLKYEPLLSLETVIEKAKQAKESGSSRFCMGAAWREAKDNQEFEQVLEMVKAVKQLGMETCCTLGMLTEEQARKLKEAGLDYYNHNLDTSPEYYSEIITTRTYQDRLETIQNVRQAGMSVCCGGIIGMGETEKDRIGLLQQLANQSPHPESVPINALVPVEGTPLGNQTPIDPLEFVQTIAVARVMMPQAYVRLSAGRLALSKEAQALCFLAGANSIFAGEKLLTTPNPQEAFDESLLNRLKISKKSVEQQATN